MRSTLVVASILAVCLALPGGERPAGAAVIPMDLDRLVEGADVALRGDVVAAEPAWTADGSMIYTTYTLRTTEALMGQVPGEVQVRVPGGTLNGLRIRNGEAPVFTLGEDVVCFLRPEASGPAWTTYGWFQGKYTLVGGMVRELVGVDYGAFRADILQAVAEKK